MKYINEVNGFFGCHKDSVSRAKWQEKSFFFLLFRGAAYLARYLRQQGKIVQAERNGKKNPFFLNN